MTAIGLKYAFDIDTPSVVGLIAGALTSTPGLAVAIDSTHSPLASIAYGIAYPFGVVGVILFVKLLPRIMHIDLEQEARRLEKNAAGSTRTDHLYLSCHQPRRLRPHFNANQCPGHDRCSNLPPQTRRANLHPNCTYRTPRNDYIQAVGSDEALTQLATLVGEREEGELPLSHTQEIESLLLTKKDMINKQLGDLNLMKNFGCTVTRIRRSGIDLRPHPTSH